MATYRTLTTLGLMVLLLEACSLPWSDGSASRADGGDPPYPEPTEDYVYAPFFDDFNDSSVDTSVWQIGRWREHGGQMSAERCYVEDGLLNLVFVNDSGDGYLSSAIQTRDEYYFGTWEARLKPSGVPGVLNSFFTIDWDDTTQSGSGDGTKQEIDIEFLTNSFGEGAGQVHYALHEDGHRSLQTNPDIDLGFDPSADFHVYGFEITPEYIEWFVDDEVLLRYEYDDPEYDIEITAPYQLKLNHWSSTGWVGGPPEEDEESVYQIDWIRFTPYE
ncbi:MAG: glycoside hydrolase family 16 protein [Spirochaetota bacterium]